MKKPVRVAVDIGGTFTDLQIHDARSGAVHAFKTPSTPQDPSIGLIEGLGPPAIPEVLQRRIDNVCSHHRLQATEDQSKHFKNPDDDPRGPWFDGNPLGSPGYRANLVYDITGPNGDVISPPKNGWRWSRATLQEKIKTGEIKFTDDGNARRNYKFLPLLQCSNQINH